MKRHTLILAILISCLLLAACSQKTKPVEASRQWSEAFSKLDAAAFNELTCAEIREASPELERWTFLFQVISQIGKQTDVPIDVSDLQFTETSNNGKNAAVQVSGSMQIYVEDITQNQPIDETWQLVKESGRWKWCGSGSPLP